MKKIYYEKQRGGLCRLHSLNAFFGRREINDTLFKKYQEEFDLYNKNKFNTKESCKMYDIINSDQNTIISYILKHKYNIYTRFFSINELCGNKFNGHMNLEKMIDKIGLENIYKQFIFVFNQNHIWGIQMNPQNINIKSNIQKSIKENKQKTIKSKDWYKIDSIGGVRNISINKMNNQKNLGFIIPINIIYEFRQRIKELKHLIFQEYKNLSQIKNNIIFNDIKNNDIKNNSIKNDDIKNNTINKENLKLHIIYILSNLHKKKLILDKIEVPLSIIIEILEINKKNKNMAEYKPIDKIICDFNEFMNIFTRGNYNNLDLIIQYIPEIITQIIILNP